MRTFHPDYLRSLTLPGSIGWLIGACMEAKGKQDLWLIQKPEVLEALREMAIIQSTESSNRIEGVTVDPDRLRPVVLGQSEPRDLPEEELVGYRRALDLIHTQHPNIDITPASIRRLHETCQGGYSGDAGQWKERARQADYPSPDRSLLAGRPEGPLSIGERADHQEGLVRAARFRQDQADRQGARCSVAACRGVRQHGAETTPSATWSAQVSHWLTTTCRSPPSTCPEACAC